MTNLVLSEPLTLDHSGPVPIYQQIKAWIQAQITSGVWPAHYKLKAEADLAAQLDVSRGTVRKAIDELTHEGLLVRTHGRGTFVASAGLEQPLAERFVTFSEDLINKAIPFTTQVIEQSRLQATDRIAAQLVVSPGGEIFYLKRLRRVEQEPFIVVNNYVIYHLCPGIETLDFTQYRLFEALEERFGITVDYGRRVFQARPADKDIAAWLGLAEGEPVMYIEQQTYLPEGALIEFSEVWLRGDRFKVSALVKRQHVGAAQISLDVLYQNQADDRKPMTTK